MTVQTRPQLTTVLGPLRLANPVLVASGPWAEKYRFPQAGAVVTKSVTLHAREGNPPPFGHPLEIGFLNRSGLKNPGLHAFLSDMLPQLQEAGSPVIVSVAGDFEAVVERLNETPGIVALEINPSCPNVANGILSDPQALAQLVARVRPLTHLPLWIKLSLHTADIADLAAAAESAGADAVSAINTIKGMAVDLAFEDGQLSVNRFLGGLSGAAIHPVALRAVWDMAQRVKIPVIGMGGIQTVDDLLRFVAAGASAVQVGGSCFMDPSRPATLVRQLETRLNEWQLPSWDALKEALWPAR